MNGWELKPCPFCAHPELCMVCDEGVAFAHCPHCGACGPNVYGYYDWNEETAAYDYEEMDG